MRQEGKERVSWLSFHGYNILSLQGHVLSSSSMPCVISVSQTFCFLCCYISCQMEVLKSFEILDRLQNEIDTAFIEECAASCSFIFLSPQYMDFSSFSLCSFPLLSHFEESHLILIIPNYIYFILNI